MQSLNVAEKGISYLYLALSTYAQGCLYLALYVLALGYVLLKGSALVKRVFLPQALMLALTVFNPVFPIILNHIFDVNNEYYRFFWIAPVVILLSLVLANLADKARGLVFPAAIIVFIIAIVSCGTFLYKGGYIPSPNIYKMPTEIPEIAEMIHEDAQGRYEGEYFPRAAFEYDYEMCMRQYDAGIMLTCSREAYLNAVAGRLDNAAILDDDAQYNRVLAVVVLGMQLSPDEFRKGLENTGTEYVCISSANEDLCRYLENNCGLRLVGKTANHSLYHYSFRENTGWILPSYEDIWENY